VPLRASTIARTARRRTLVQLAGRVVLGPRVADELDAGVEGDEGRGIAPSDRICVDLGDLLAEADAGVAAVDHQPETLFRNGRPLVMTRPLPAKRPSIGWSRTPGAGRRPLGPASPFGVWHGR